MKELQRKMINYRKFSFAQFSSSMIGGCVNHVKSKLIYSYSNKLLDMHHNNHNNFNNQLMSI